MREVALSVLLHAQEADDRDDDVRQGGKASDEALERIGIEDIELPSARFNRVARAKIGGVGLKCRNVATCKADFVASLGKRARGGAADIGGAPEHQNSLA
jgi:hypothetical protein